VSEKKILNDNLKDELVVVLELNHHQCTPLIARPEDNNMRRKRNNR